MYMHASISKLMLNLTYVIDFSPVMISDINSYYIYRIMKRFTVNLCYPTLFCTLLEFFLTVTRGMKIFLALVENVYLLYI